MKKSLIGTLAIGLIIGGALTVNSFANEKQAETQVFTNTANPVVTTTNQQDLPQAENQFRVLNQETNQFEQLDDSSYRNYNNNGYASCCQYNNNGMYGNIN